MSTTSPSPDTAADIAILKRYVVTHPDHSFKRNGMVHWWWRGLERHPEFQAVLATEH